MKYIASWSGGKDSTANIIIAHEKGEPLDMIIFAEVMFDEKISGELPEHIDFIKNKCIPLFNEWGYETKILHSEKTYMDCFNQIIKKPRKHKENKGKRKGFPMAGKCNVNRDCKSKAIYEFYNKFDKRELVQYIGIAIDEQTRLERIRVADVPKISLLEKYGYTEKMAFELCKKYGLLSPIYEFAPRGGCWFCPNARDCELKHLRKNHQELWNKMLDLENESNIVGQIWNTRKNMSIHDKEKKFAQEDAQITIFDFL